MPPVIFDNRHVEIVCVASARVNVSVFYQFVDTAKRLWPTSLAPRRVSFGRAARGSVAPRKMACRPAPRADMVLLTVQGHQPAHRKGGQPGRCPFSRVQNGPN